MIIYLFPFWGGGGGYNEFWGHDIRLVSSPFLLARLRITVYMLDIIPNIPHTLLMNFEIQDKLFFFV